MCATGFLMSQGEEQLMDNLGQILRTRFGGVISAGKHEPDGQACALELYAVAIGHEWTDNPQALGMPEIRGLNDAFHDERLRTQHMLRVLTALYDYPNWSADRKRQWCERIVIETMRRIIAELPLLPDTTREQCRGVTILGAARWAEEAAMRAAEAAAAAEAAETAAREAKKHPVRWAAAAARWAAAAAERWTVAEGAAAADRVLVTACDIWVEAAHGGVPLTAPPGVPPGTRPA
jgi:hypothetical protein